MTALAAAIVLTASCRGPGEEKHVTVATTPELVGSGLPQQLVTTFMAQSRVRIELLVVDEERIARLASRGAADAAIVSSSEAERLRPSHPINLLATFAYDDFALVGPKRDPAHVAASKTATQAFRKIYEARAAFCGPSQVPAFRGREAEIWRAAGLDPHDSPRYAACKGDANDVLAESARRGAYTITDRATLEKSRAMKRLAVILRDVPLFENDQTVVLFADPQRNPNAVWFVQWLMSDRARETVDTFRLGDGRRFFTNH